MIRHIAPLTLGAVATGLTALLFVLPASPKISDSPDLSGTLIQNVSVIQPDGSLSEPLSILTEDGVISRIGELSDVEAETILDGTGLTALPGLIDSHTHSYNTARSDAARFGVTTLLDMFTDASVLDVARSDRENTGPSSKADLFSAGMLATAPGGHGTQFGLSIETLTTPEEAPAWVAARKAEGSDYIKLVYMPGIAGFPSLDRPTAKAVIEASHAEGLMAVAHISTHAGAEDMIGDGIDGLVHIFADKIASSELVALTKERGTFIIPTLTVIASVDGGSNSLTLNEDDVARLSSMQSQSLGASFGSGLPGFSLAIAIENVKRFHEAGVPILAGSDAPNPGTAHGASLHHELQLLVRAGLTPVEALAAASLIPAELFGLEGRASLEAGHRADILLIDGNPAEDINATLNIRHILKNGSELDRSVQKGPSGRSIDTGLLGDFETGLTSMEGLDWVASTDDMAGGASEVVFGRVEGGANGSAFALKVDASVKAGFPYPWSGVSVVLTSNGTNGPIDISDHSALQFDIRGTPQSYRVMGFGAGAQGVPPTQNVEVSQTWETRTLALSDFGGLQLDSLVGFGFVAGPETGESTIYLDNVKLIK